MAGRRATGEGSIYRRKADGRWVGAIHLGYDNGKRRRRVVYGDTQREVLAKLQQVRAEQLAPDTDSRGGEQTLDAFLDRWLRIVAPSLAGPTVTSYESLLRVHVRPTLGGCTLRSLTTLALQELLVDIQAAGRSARTAQFVHSVLRRALNDAQRWELIAVNPAVEVRAPRVRRREPNPFSADEVRDLLGALQPERLQALFLLALTSGLRLGELLALQWGDLSEAGATLHVRRTRRRDHTIAEPKSAAGRREVDLPAAIVGQLEQHDARQTAELRLCGASLTEVWMFTTEMGQPLAARHVQTVWRRIVNRAGISYRGFHHLRKTYASMLVERGVDVRTAQLLLGHADVRMTLEVYTRTSPAARAAAATAVAAGFPGLEQRHQLATTASSVTAGTSRPGTSGPREEWENR